MDKCRCKFKCTEIRQSYYTSAKTYVFTPEYDQSIKEDQRFAKASPSGRFEIAIDNPGAQAFFVLGEAYYFDASAVPKPEAAAG